MVQEPLLISTGTLTRESLAGKVAVVTGAGGGIGYEAARALAWLGAGVVIAEINRKRGKAAEAQIRAEIGEIDNRVRSSPERVRFIATDVGSERSVRSLYKQVMRAFGKADIVINNATVAPLGGIHEVSIRDWDASYRVNLRGPALMAQAFLPGMTARKSGAFICVSSVGGAYMAAYESLKTAQVELARTLDAEMEGSGVNVFTISPGIVPTETANAGVAKIAARYGKTLEEFFETYKEQWISVEAAGAGFAAAAVFAERFRGLETYSKSGLAAAGIDVPEMTSENRSVVMTLEQAAKALAMCREVLATLEKEHAGWMSRPLFERQWMLRDFKQNSGKPVEEAIASLKDLEGCLQVGDGAGTATGAGTARGVAKYFIHYKALAEGSVKDPVKAKEWSGMIQGWYESADCLAKMLEEA